MSVPVEVGWVIGWIGTAIAISLVAFLGIPMLINLIVHWVAETFNL